MFLEAKMLEKQTMRYTVLEVRVDLALLLLTSESHEISLTKDSSSADGLGGEK